MIALLGRIEEMKLSLGPAFTGLNVQVWDSSFILSEKEVNRQSFNQRGNKANLLFKENTS